VVSPLQTRLRILEDAFSLQRGDEFRRDVKPTDDLRCLAILRDEVKARGLGDWQRYRIEAWDHALGWIPHRPTSRQ
jgi:hypothetical protein